LAEDGFLEMKLCRQCHKTSASEMEPKDIKKSLKMA